MIKISNKIGSNRYFLKIYVDDSVYEIKYEDLMEYFSSANQLEIEGASAYVDNERQLVVMRLVVARGQGGIVFVWDAIKKRIVHLCNGDYSIKACVVLDKVFILRLVANYGKDACLHLDYYTFGIMDAYDHESSVEIPINIQLDNDSTFEENDYILEFDGENLIVGYKNHINTISI